VQKKLNKRGIKRKKKRENTQKYTNAYRKWAENGPPKNVRKPAGKKAKKKVENCC
jgi:hypothetical protein